MTFLIFQLKINEVTERLRNSIVELSQFSMKNLTQVQTNTKSRLLFQTQDFRSTTFSTEEALK